MKTGCYFSK